MRNLLAEKSSATAEGDREIVLTRQLDAPRDLVWRAFTQPDDIVQWWGPHGFTTTTHAWDFRVGGLWRFTMHGPDGTHWPNWIRYTLIEAPARMEYDHGGGNADMRDFEAIVTLDVEGEGTRVTLRLIMPDRKSRDEKVGFGVLQGGQQTLERLEAYLPKLSAKGGI
jgi:uncharacterized protein YndB with AHSA1/START domain